MASIETLTDLIATHSESDGTRTAIEYEGQHITYHAIDRNSDRVAQALAASGIGRGGRVAVLMKNVPEFFDLLFGVAKVGAVLVPVNWRLTSGEVAQILGDAGADLVVADTEYEKSLRDIQRGNRELRVYLLGEQGSYRAWLAAQPESGRAAVDVDPDDVAVQFYTSGTTGLPKGVLLTHRNFFATIDGLATSWRIEPESRVLAAMPMFHIGGSGWSLTPLYRGATLSLLPEANIDRLVEALPTCTHAFLVPAVIHGLVDESARREVKTESLDMIVYGAAPIAPALLARAMDAFGCEFVQVYGSTETCGAVVELSAPDHDPAHLPELLASCGRPYPWVQLMIADQARLAGGELVETTAGTVGEVLVRSSQVMRGYWQRPTETASVQLDGGWFRMGDAGYLDAGGYLYLFDRVSDLIISGGENVYPVEVERVIAEHPMVADVAVIGVPHEKWGETVKAVVVLASAEDRLDTEELATRCRENLAGFKCPTSVDIVESLPRNASGKVLKRDLRAPYWVDSGRRIS